MIVSLILTACGQEKVVETVVVKETVVETVVEEKVETVVETVVEKETVVVEATAVPAVHEAPMLHEQVLAGTLPPLEERIPAEPYVLEPFGEIGKYGGTWHRFDTSTDGRHLQMAMYGHSFIHWVRDGLEVRPGLAKGWEASEDKTEWTLYFREGTRWSNGDPFTVDDILYWWEDLVLNPDHPYQPPDYFIAGGETVVLTKIDDYTLQFNFAGPAPLFVDRLAMWPNGMEPTSERLVMPSNYLKQFHPDYSEAVDFNEHDEKSDWKINPECPVLNAWMPVAYEPGVRMSLERNPYYYAVDTAGNQLPYIDRIEMQYVEDLEVSFLHVLAGEQEFCGRPCKYYDLANLSVLRNAEAEVGFTSYLWDGGSGTGAMFFTNWNHPDPEKQEVYRMKEFRRALSHAINRPLIQKVVYFGTGEPTTGTLSPKAVEYHRTERGRELYAAWRDLAVEYDPEGAMALLDEAGIVDQDGDGWRDMPSGEPLELRMDQAATASSAYVSANEIVKDNWEAVGLKTIINAFPPDQSVPMRNSATFDIWSNWEVGDGPNHLVYPQWLVPIWNERWAPLYGAWYWVKGTDKEGTELDKDPRDRTPPREEPAPDDPVARLQALYDLAKVEPDDEKRESLVLDMIQIHVDEGPFFIGTVGNLPTIVVAKNNVGNVPNREQLGTGGFTNPWIMVYFGAVFPEQFYFKDQ